MYILNILIHNQRLQCVFILYYVNKLFYYTICVANTVKTWKVRTFYTLIFSHNFRKAFDRLMTPGLRASTQGHYFSHFTCICRFLVCIYFETQMRYFHSLNNSHIPILLQIFNRIISLVFVSVHTVLIFFCRTMQTVSSAYVRTVSRYSEQARVNTRRTDLTFAVNVCASKSFHPSPSELPCARS